MSERNIPIEWLRRGDEYTLPKGAFARVLALDLDCEPPTNLAPNDEDMADLARPGAAPRNYFLRRRLALRALLGASLGVDPREVRISYDLEGAPRLLSHKAFVSVASRGSIAALAIASSPIGIDLEPLDAENPAPVVREVLHPRELLALQETPDHFLRLWTAKEAYLKAHGAGLVRDPAQIEISLEPQRFLARDGQRQFSGEHEIIELQNMRWLVGCLTL
jgi:phosphopantetheinyl transferase